MHVFSAAEYEHVRRYGLRNPVAVIPNGVALETLEGAGAGDQSGDRDRRCVLFLGRLHRKKGVSFLLEAWAGLGEAAREWELVIAGPDSGGYGAKMQGLADRLGIAERVRFVGELAGVEKISALKGADVFVLPSRSEGFSMAVLEAAGCGVPSLITDACHFGELAEAGGAVEVEPNAEGVREGLRYLMGLGEARRREMGEKGRRLVAANYRWEAVCEQMVGVYRWLLGTGQEPRCVRRD